MLAIQAVPPSRYVSRFQIGARALSVSIAYSQASKAAPRCGAADRDRDARFAERDRGRCGARSRSRSGPKRCARLGRDRLEVAPAPVRRRLRNRARRPAARRPATFRASCRGRCRSRRAPDRSHRRDQRCKVDRLRTDARSSAAHRRQQRDLVAVANARRTVDDDAVARETRRCAQARRFGRAGGQRNPNIVERAPARRRRSVRSPKPSSSRKRANASTRSAISSRPDRSCSRAARATRGSRRVCPSRSMRLQVSLCSEHLPEVLILIVDVVGNLRCACASARAGPANRAARAGRAGRLRIRGSGRRAASRRLLLRR